MCLLLKLNALSFFVGEKTKPRFHECYFLLLRPAVLVTFPPHFLSYRETKTAF